MRSRKQIKALIVFIAFIIIFASFAINSYAISNDNGLIYEKYIGIYNEAQLKSINDNLSGSYILMNDIALSEEWTPIDKFTGLFDGNGFTIKNITNSNCDGFGGLFSVNEGVIKNVNILGASFTFDGLKGAYFHCGAICGRNYGVVENCTAQNVEISYRAHDFEGSAEALIGGIVGWNEYGTIRYCLSSNVNAAGDISLNGSSSNYYLNDIGGIVGFTRGGVINDCIVVNSILSAHSTITNYQYIRCGSGGICGHARSDASIYNCYSLYNTLHSTDSSGDILGINTACSESNNHNTFDGTLATGFSSDIWGIRGIYDYPVIILPQNYSCSGGHTSDNTWVENKVMTCESNGERVQHCTVCGRVAKAEVIKTNGHSYDNFIIISGSKLIPPIVKERKCDVCGYVEQVTDWSYIWITIIVGLVVIGVMIGLINYFRGLRRTRG